MQLAQGITEFAASLSAALGPKSERPEALRLGFEKSSGSQREARPEGLRVRDWHVTVPGREIPIRLYRPAATGLYPTLLYFHGGGWVAGSLDTHDGIAAGIAHQAGVLVVSVHYRRAPENPHPAAVEDGFEVLQWLLREGDLHDVDVERVGVAGDSAGGHIAAALTQRVKRSNRPRLRCQVLIYPAIDPDFTTLSYQENATAPFLSTADMRRFWDLYMPNGDASDPVCFPARAIDREGLPPALIVCAQYDPLRDDGINYGRALATAGNEVEVRTVPGMVHSFLRAIGVSPPAKAEFDFICARVRLHLASPRKE